MNEVIVPQHQWPEALFYLKVEESIGFMRLNCPEETKAAIFESVLMMFLITTEPAGTA